MRQRLCNRCGEQHRPMNPQAGSLNLKYGFTEISAELCPDCYCQIVEFYRDGVNDD